MIIFRKVTHIIFDLDGLILDTEEVYASVIQQIAKKYGKIYTKSIKMKILGTTEQDTAKLAVREMQLPITSEEFGKQFRALIEIGLANATLMPGAEKLIRHLYKHRIPIAVATSSSKASCDVKLKRFPELFSLFSHRVMGSSDPAVKQGKPAPDIFLVCAARFEDGVLPKECLVFEDAPNGATGAIAAGMQVVMVPDPDANPSLCNHATLVLNSLENFQPELFGLPPF